MKIACYEVFEEEEISLRALLPSQWNVRYFRRTVQESGAVTTDSDVVSIRTQSAIPLEWATTLKGILSRSTGYDHLTNLKQALITEGTRIPAMGYLREYATRAVAEHACILLSSLMRKLPLQLRSMERFERDGLTGSELLDKNLVVVGVGRIGSEIARIATALGMRVFGVDIVPDKHDVTYISPAQAWQTADAIVCAMNLTDENKGYFNDSVYSQVKKGVLLVNIARGEHTPFQPLAEALEKGVLGGIGLDVYENEAIIAADFRKANSVRQLLTQTALLRRIMSHPNCICTPHNAFNSAEAVHRKSKETLRQLARFESDQTFDPCV